LALLTIWVSGIALVAPSRVQQTHHFRRALPQHLPNSVVVSDDGEVVDVVLKSHPLHDSNQSASFIDVGAVVQQHHESPFEHFRGE